MSSGADHIGVCICTFKRASLLKPLLLGMDRQKLDGGFTFSVHVVDNDARGTAESVVAESRRRSRVAVSYDVEPIQNIAMARNRAVAASRGNFIAFMDDDEFPADDWLARLYAACREYRADGALGPVKPHYTPETPSWLRKSRLCERPSHPTGTVLNFLQTRTGNVLFRRGILEGVAEPFPPAMGREGGEDIDFFRRMIARGHKFVWCEEAPVFEHILAERCKPAYYLDKYLRIGGLTGETMRTSYGTRLRGIARSGFMTVLFGAIAAGGAVLGPHAVMRSLVKGAYHAGVLAGCIGYVPVRERRDR